MTISIHGTLLVLTIMTRGTTEINQAYQDTLTADDWTLDPSVFAFQLNFRPSTYEVGNLGKGWEFTDPNTYVVHLRQGIHCQNIPPVNGREFTSDDVVYHYDRLLGLGDGLHQTQPLLCRGYHLCKSKIGNRP